MLTLYHFPRAICAQKVRLALAEKALDFDSRVVAPAELRSPDYLALNKQGYVPTLVHDGFVVTESRLISEYLEDAFPAAPLLPASAAERWRMRSWTKQIDDSLHLNVYILSFVTSFRAMYLGLSPEAQQRYLPFDPIKRMITLELAEQAAESAFFARATNRFRALLKDMDQALAVHEWLVGDRLTLADVDYTPYLRRLQELGYWQLVAGQYPNVARWFDTMRARPSFDTALTAWESAADREREARDIARARPLFQAALAA